MNPTEIAIQTALELLAEFQPAPARPEPNRLDVALAPSQLVAAVEKLQAARWGYLAAITGLDGGAAKDTAGDLEVLYHFCHAAAVVTLRVRLPRQAPATPTLCGVIASAGPLERELGEMFGVEITDSPDTNRLYLPEDWPPGLYPLRKDAPLAELEAHTDANGL
jgi:Ni,Fe-hydrogenase III component G